ncbi:hypothetical protein [Halomonas sp. LBP4]|uniref:hypothetical protein n=1 Tax=Halomonas sp. LBP4 TaxID=2044917 RepID=UPI0011B55136|nr:hypothetical protein [Halomonas sp. LBP4]
MSKSLPGLGSQRCAASHAWKQFLKCRSRRSRSGCGEASWGSTDSIRPSRLHQALPRLMAGMLCFGYLLVFAITVVGGWLNDLSGTVALAFLPTLLISLVAMASTRRLLVSRPQEA